MSSEAVSKICPVVYEKKDALLVNHLDRF